MRRLLAGLAIAFAAFAAWGQSSTGQADPAPQPATASAPGAKPAAGPTDKAATTAAANRLEVFVRDGCPHCAKAKEFLARLAKERPELEIVIRDVLEEPAALARLQDLVRQQRGATARVPAFHAGGQLILGFSEEASTDKLILAALRGQKVKATDKGPGDTSCAAMDGSTCREEVEAPAEDFSVTIFGRTITLDDVGLPAFTFAMGLLDGLNPCSMWVLILMISLLATLNDRRRMLAIAGTFVLVEGVAYFVFMAAWLNLFLLIGMSRASQVAVALIAIAAGAINIKDWYAPGQGFSLSISDKHKPGIYARMRAILHAKSLPAAIVGVIVLGLLVQVVEFLCTSGFPALFTRILTLRNLDTASYYGYLLLYNVAYMLDDVIVLSIGVATLSSRRLQEKEGRLLKLLAGVAMVGLGVYLLVAG